MKSTSIRIDRLALRLRGVSAREARERSKSIARQVAQAVARQATRTSGREKHIDHMTVSASSAFEPQIERQWTEK